jgi:putative tryptophan/tyrosine transport system substrate-binding protein
MASGIAAKRLELLKEAVPTISRVLVLSYRVDPIAAPQLEELEVAASSLGVKLLVHDIRTAEDIPDAGVREGGQGVLTTAESIFAAQGKRVVQLTTEHRLPGLYPYRLTVEAGGLMALDSYTVGLQARTAIYVDKILKGANPSDLPVELPTKFELIINMKTANWPDDRSGIEPLFATGDLDGRPTVRIPSCGPTPGGLVFRMAERGPAIPLPSLYGHLDLLGK